MEAIKRALLLYEQRESWNALQRHGMRQDFSWRRSARSYLALYRQTLSK